MPPIGARGDASAAAWRARATDTSRKGCRNNLFYNKDGRIVYHTAALGVVYDKQKHEQFFFHGHDDDITALAIHPKDRLTIATGQLGKDPKILIWRSRPDEQGSRHLPQLCVIHGDHKRAILGLSFSASGEFIASIGNDNNRSIGVYRWKKDTPLEKMRIGFDKVAPPPRITTRTAREITRAMA
jgi:microtubule-associated protein-like 6